MDIPPAVNGGDCRSGVGHRCSPPDGLTLHSLLRANPSEVGSQVLMVLTVRPYSAALDSSSMRNCRQPAAAIERARRRLRIIPETRRSSSTTVWFSRMMRVLSFSRKCLRWLRAARRGFGASIFSPVLSVAKVVRPRPGADPPPWGSARSGRCSAS